MPNSVRSFNYRFPSLFSEGRCSNAASLRHWQSMGRLARLCFLHLESPRRLACCADLPHRAVGPLEISREARRVEQGPGRAVGGQLIAQGLELVRLMSQPHGQALVLDEIG